MGSTVEPFFGEEKIANFSGSSTYVATQYAVNPGNLTTFPWLGQKAKLYEKYHFSKLQFMFKPTINEFSANATGKVVFAFDTDAADAPPANINQAEVMQPGANDLPYMPFVLNVPQKDMNETMLWRYVRPGNVPGGGDIKTYDCGVLNVCTQGNTNTSEVGELWVIYEGMFKNRVLESTTTAPTNSKVAWFQSTSNESMGATTVAKNMAVATASANGVSAVNTSGSIVLPAGNYLLDATVVISNTAGDVFTLSSMDVQKNAASVFTAALIPGSTQATGQKSYELSAHVWVSSNGTDAFTFPVTATYGSGTATMAGSVRFTAIG